MAVGICVLAVQQALLGLGVKQLNDLAGEGEVQLVAVNQGGTLFCGQVTGNFSPEFLGVTDEGEIGEHLETFSCLGRDVVGLESHWIEAMAAGKHHPLHRTPPSNGE